MERVPTGDKCQHPGFKCQRPASDHCANEQKGGMIGDRKCGHHEGSK